MCSVSIFHNAGSLLLTANRDELRTRGECGVQQDFLNELQCIYPVDDEAKGTWVGANNYGIVAALLNMYEANHPGSQSRGLIIPQLLECKSLSEAHNYLTKSFKPDAYATFVLLVMDRQSVYRYCWDGQSMSVQSFLQNTSAWLLETSSSVDTEQILLHRQQLFKQWQQHAEKTHHSSDILSFHLTRDPKNSSSSICMAREHTHTKSITQISINSTAGEVRYLAPEVLESVVNTSPEANALNTIKFNLLGTKDTKEHSDNISLS